MRDLPNPKRQVGYFCRILAGAWVDWRPGMEVQQSDTVVSEGRLYRVQANPDGTAYTSVRPDTQEGRDGAGRDQLGRRQNDVTYTAGVRNVVFRDIFLEKPRVAFSIHFDNDRYSRWDYPGAAIPLQENLSFENVRVLYDSPADFFQIRTPVNVLSVANSSLRNNRVSFLSNKAMTDYGRTHVSFTGCVFGHPGKLRRRQQRARQNHRVEDGLQRRVFHRFLGVGRSRGGDNRY